MDSFGRYILDIDEQVLYVLNILRETQTYVEFVQIPVRQGYSSANTSRFQILDYNTLKGTESNGTTTIYQRRH